MTETLYLNKIHEYTCTFRKAELMSKLSVKYLDAETGDYKYATVIDVGDLDKLNTKVKSDLVSAINSIGITGELPGGIQNQLDEINQNINDIKSGELTEHQIAEINKKITEGISNLVTEVDQLNVKINDEIVKAKNELLGDMDQKLENVENDYNSKIGIISGSLDGAKADIDSVESDLIKVGTKLQTAETNYTKVSSDIDTINGEISTKVDSSDFDLMESKVSQNTTEIEQTKEDISLLATKSSLDLTTDRVAKAESDIKINADGLSSRVTYTELNKQLDNASKYGDNILRGTRNWDNWETNNIAKAYISNDTYRHCKMQVIENKQYYYETELDGLEIGKTYIASIYFKTEVESDYASVNINIGSESIPLDNLVEDTLILNGWKRVSANFVASDVKTKVSFRFSFLDTNNIGYLVASKIETGIKPSEWKPHFDDDNESIIKNESLIKQNSDSIVSLVSSTEKLGEDVETANTQVAQTAESLSLQAQKITDIEGEVSENKASIVLANNKIETKVSQTDVNKSISDISLDTKNRIINSDFSRGFSNWNEINSGFTIKKISGVNYAHIDRSGLINASIASMSSDKFPAKNGDKLVFSLDFMTESISSLDDKSIITIELFSINDTRVFSKTFNVGDFNVSIVNNVITRIGSKYIIDREDVAKARLKIQLNKNGSVNFSKISLQKGDLKEKEWLLAPEDVQLLNVDLQTSIKQNADSIELRATKTELNTINNAIKENKASIELTNNAISQKVSSTDVEGILSGKAYATKSELTQTSNSLTSTISKIQTDVGGKADKTELSQLSQDLSGFKTTVSNTYLSKSDASGTYADKVSVASQITQSATAVTSNVQSWTNNKLTAYSTTQQTATSITNAVASKADKSQVTQLSNQITSVVSGITNESLLSTQMISSTTLKHPNYPDMPMVGIPVTNGESYTVSSNLPNDGTAAAPTAHVWFSILPSKTPNSAINGIYDGKSITLPAMSDKIYIVFRSQAFADMFISGKYWVKVTKTPASQSQITQLSDNINLRVSKGDVTSQINLEAGRTLIDTKQLLLNADNVKFSGSAFIPNSVIQNLSADKITAGTLNAANVNIINLNATNITTGTLTGANLSMNLDDGEVLFQKGSIKKIDNSFSIDITNGVIESYNYMGGFTLKSGEISFRNTSVLNTGSTEKYGSIVFDWVPGGTFSGVYNGISVKGTDGWAIGTANSVAAGISTGSVGSAIVGSKTSSTWFSQGDITIEAGNVYDNGAFKLTPSISIGAGNRPDILITAVTTEVRGNLLARSNLSVIGKLSVTGSKNAVHVTRDGVRATPAYETAESYLGDIGRSYTRENYEVWVEIDPLFSDTVNTDIAYEVFLQAYDNAIFWVGDFRSDKFLVKSDKPMSRFAWELKAKRRGYENERLVLQKDIDYEKIEKEWRNI